jgi:hypothetical protein
MTAELVARAKGVKYQTMLGLGHFPMSEDSIHFRSYTAPVLEEIRSLPT